MRNVQGVLLLLAAAAMGCEIGAITGGPGVEPPFVEPGDLDTVDFRTDETVDDPNLFPGPPAPAPPPGEPYWGEEGDAAIGVDDVDAGTDIPGTGEPDAGDQEAVEPERCERSAARFTEAFEKLADDHAECETDGDCTVVRARMVCPDKNFDLTTCARAVGTEALEDIRAEITYLAAVHFCTDATAECVEDPECVWPEEEAACIDNVCTPVYP
jgi:hypothetical protein